MGKATKPAAKQGGAFDALADLMGAGDLAGLTSQDASNNFSVLSIEEIAVKEQVRKVFDGEDSTIAELAESIKVRGVMQPVIVRPVAGEKPYELVAGERRLRASILAGLSSIPAMVRELSDEEAVDAQVAENIHRLNLSQLETAAQMQRDLEALGGGVEAVDALMEKHQKSRGWVSKWLALNSLGEQAQRVISENVSADLEVINTVKQVEKVNPEAAKALVDELKENRGKKDASPARKIAKDAKDTVKPQKKKQKAEKLPPAPINNPDAVAKPIDKSHEEHGPVVSVPVGGSDGGTADGGSDDGFNAFASMLDDIEATKDQAPEAAAEAGDDQGDENRAPALPPAALLADAYARIYQKGESVQAVLNSMSSEERDGAENWLTAFYEQGIEAKDVGSAVIRGFRSGIFSTEDHGAFALAAFLYGLDSEGKFSMLNILGSVKA